MFYTISQQLALLAANGPIPTGQPVVENDNDLFMRILTVITAIFYR